jgi:uncharacterized membrane-anchored protein
MQEGNYNINIRQPPVVPNNAPVVPVIPNNEANDKLCFGNRGSFICITISYLLAFICEQFTMKDRIPGIVLGVMAAFIGFPAPFFVVYPTIKTFSGQGQQNRKSGFAQRILIGMFLYVLTIIVATMLIVNAVHGESSVQGLAVVCSSLLGYSALLFYIDQPRPN